MALGYDLTDCYVAGLLAGGTSGGLVRLLVFRGEVSLTHQAAVELVEDGAETVPDALTEVRGPADEDDGSAGYEVW